VFVFGLSLVFALSQGSWESPSIRRIPVTLTAIRSDGYDSRSSVLEIEFTSESVYRYYHVSPDVANGLMSAPSKGKYFNKRIRNVGYRYELLRKRDGN